MKPIEEDIKEIKGRIGQCSIFIKRVPSKSERAFKKLAFDDFCGDYGFCFKHILDFYFGLIPSGIEHLEEEVEKLSNRFSFIEQAYKDKDDSDVKRRLDGSGRIEK